jgi:glycosyltransferase involved in cell wall biosynthesis
MTRSDFAHVAILMCTYNGAEFIAEQLKSFEDQTHSNWSLWVSDDGSSDATLDIVASFQQRHPDRRIEIFEGPKAGFSQNFQSLLLREIDAEYYAISDQDDIWHPEKLERATAIMSERGVDLYGARTTTMLNSGAEVGQSPLFTKPPDFRNALVQSIMGGNTMVLSRQFSQFVAKTTIMDVASHDWWLYMLCTGSGHSAFYDPQPMILYRQHGSNLLGANTGWNARKNRIFRLVRGDFAVWNATNIHALKSHFAMLTPQSQKAVASFEALRTRRGFAALVALKRLGLFRQTTAGQISLFASAFLGRL